MPFPEHTAFAGADAAKATSALVLLHGRGATAADILSLADALGVPAGMAVVAPQAAGNTWYPARFIAPLMDNEPELTRALETVGEVIESLDHHGIAPENIVLGGFSQGACLALDFALRHARRWGGVLAFSGGLIGPPGTTWKSPGTLDGTPVFLGCADADPHIPVVRVEESARVFDEHGADVTARLYRGMWHSILPEELDAARDAVPLLRG